ncbi:uroporphyrinogen-III C-methyltransferase [Thalassomonas actiniarum]|uniref:Uroporphyrinogen-III C-methyltransferase n=1 Tax=Thalassomonas actiniarum TaxID=485447 RepID=A0AAE9YQV9_9GAMM|nr:uroporphyrinogen-III C-methyltransferase [Thalassomonas actiniarum]WDD99012.1 uroporphyrinogen-III C-methyltransferase [Thalassomonas actiniarum]
MTEQKQPEDTVQENASAADKAGVSPATDKKPPGSAHKNNQASIKAKMKKDENNKTAQVSKTGVLALMLALLACAGSAGLYYWQSQQQPLQQAQTQKTLSQQLEAKLKSGEQQLSQLLQAREQQLTEHFNRQINALKSQSEQNLAQLNQTLKGLQQEQPGNWLFNEAEYLIRMASRTLWLEQNTDTAISLLTDADKRLSQMNNPALLPVRQLIFQDIETLKLLPRQQSAQVILTLMGLDKQLGSLVMARPYRQQNQEQAQDLTLTSDPADWRENLAKVWQKFRANYIITSRPRTKGDDPLLSPQHQQNLQENLALKLQLAIWSASKGESTIYRQTLDDIQQWLNQYYESENKTNQGFIAAIEKLKPATLTVNYPDKLVSLAAIRKVIAQNNSNTAVPGQANGQPPAIKTPEEQLPKLKADQDGASL